MSEQLNLGRVTLRIDDPVPDELEICASGGKGSPDYYEYVSRDHALVLLDWLKRWLEPTADSAEPRKSA